MRRSIKLGASFMNEIRRAKGASKPDQRRALMALRHWPWRARGRVAKVLGLLAAAAALTVAGSSVAAAAGGTPRPLTAAKWQQAVQQLRLPGKGCYTAS